MQRKKFSRAFKLAVRDILKKSATYFARDSI